MSEGDVNRKNRAIFDGFWIKGGKTNESLMKFAKENEEVYTSVMEVLTQQVIDITNAFLDVGAAGFFYCSGGNKFIVAVGCESPREPHIALSCGVK